MNTSTPCSGTGVSLIPQTVTTCKGTQRITNLAHLLNQIHVKSLHKNVLYIKANMTLLKLKQKNLLFLSKSEVLKSQRNFTPSTWSEQPEPSDIWLNSVIKGLTD